MLKINIANKTNLNTIVDFQLQMALETEGIELSNEILNLK